MTQTIVSATRLPKVPIYFILFLFGEKSTFLVGWSHSRSWKDEIGIIVAHIPVNNHLVLEHCLLGIPERRMLINVREIGIALQREIAAVSAFHSVFCEPFIALFYLGNGARSEIQFVNLHTCRNKIYQASESCSFRLLLLLSKSRRVGSSSPRSNP